MQCKDDSNSSNQKRSAYTFLHKAIGLPGLWVGVGVAGGRVGDGFTPQHDPSATVMSSIAMSPWKEAPATPSNLSCKEKK